MTEPWREQLTPQQKSMLERDRRDRRLRKAKARVILAENELRDAKWNLELTEKEVELEALMNK